MRNTTIMKVAIEHFRAMPRPVEAYHGPCQYFSNFDLPFLPLLSLWLTNQFASIRRQLTY